MLETSKDLFFLSAALAILLFTVVLCVLLYQFIAIMKNFREVSGKVRKTVQIAEDILENVKTKINSTANYIGVAVNSIEKIVDYLQKKNSSQTRKNKASSDGNK